MGAGLAALDIYEREGNFERAVEMKRSELGIADSERRVRLLADIGKITSVAVKTVEGGKDDISAPGQCVAALDLCTGLPDSKKANYLEPSAGHYGIFAGRSWRDNIRPLVLDFIDANCDLPKAPVKGVAAH